MNNVAMIFVIVFFKLINFVKNVTIYLLYRASFCAFKVKECNLEGLNLNPRERCSAMNIT